jgi:hypothetical protein
MIALHAQVMTEKGNNLEASWDVLARLTKNVYAGTSMMYDDKAKSLILCKYGLFWKAYKNFNLSLEYNQTGDRSSIDGTFFHRINATTLIGS